MNNINDKEELLRNLQDIKDALKKNNNIMKYISFSKAIKYTALLMGIFIIALNLSIIWLTDHYNSYGDIPVNVKAIMYSLIVIIIAAIGWVKVTGIMKFARKFRKDINFVKMMKEVYSKTLLLLVIPNLMVILTFVVYLSVSGLSYLIVPILAIFVSLLMISFIVVFNMKDMLISFEWILLSGLFSLFVAENIAAPLMIIYIFGIGMILLYLSAVITSIKEKRG